MGLDTHSLNLVRLLASRQSLGRVATIGRQELSINSGLRTKFNVSRDERYCESLLLRLGATSVHSFDVSDYEGATYIVDLNEPLSFSEQYDTVLDFGSLEHVWNQPVAFRNLIELAAEGGRICHVLPANNLSGHGLWQYCSDLMYQIYSELNGFVSTEVYYASSLDPRYWFKTTPAEPGQRTELASIEPVQLLSVTTKMAKTIRSLRVQQPFYDQQVPVGRYGNPAQVKSPTYRKLRWNLRELARRQPMLYLAGRNLWHLIDLARGGRGYALNASSIYERVDVEVMLSGLE